MKPDKPNPRPPTNNYLISILIVSSHLCICVLSLSALRSKTLYEFLFYPFITTSPAHYVLRIFTRILFAGRHKSWGTSLRNPFLSSVTHYLLSPNMFLGTLYFNTLYIYIRTNTCVSCYSISFITVCVNNITTKTRQQRSMLFKWISVDCCTHTRTHTHKVKLTLPCRRLWCW
jgi:hypothetical protein